MKPEWRAPACYLGVALLCALYLWTSPGFAIADVMAGAGLGAAAMWALNDWETRHPRLADEEEDEEDVAEAPRLREPQRPVRYREPEPEEPPRRARKPREPDERTAARTRPVSREDLPVEAPVQRRTKLNPRQSEVAWEEDAEWRETPPRQPAMAPARETPATPPRETPIEAWRREVRERDQARIEDKLRQFADTPPTDEPPFGTPERPPLPARGTADRKAADRWSRPTRQGARSFPRN